MQVRIHVKSDRELKKVKKLLRKAGYVLPAKDADTVVTQIHYSKRKGE